METDDLVANVEAMTKSKQSFEKTCRSLEEQAADAKAKYDENEKSLTEANAKKARMASEINELKRILEEKESLNGQMTRGKNSMQQSNEEIKRQLEEEVEGKNELMRQLSKSNGEVGQWKTKYETDAIQRTEELEEAKKKLSG